MFHQKPLLGKLPIWTPNPAGIPSPAGAWIMNEGSGGLVNDQSGNGNDGNFVNSPEWEADHIKFVDTDNDYISCGTNALKVTNKITIITKVYTDADYSGRLFSKHDGDYGIQLSRSLSDDSVEFRISKTGADWNGGVTSANSFLLNRWYTIGAVYDGCHMKVYVDDREDIGGDFPVALTGNINDSSQDIQIARDDNSGDSKSFRGLIKYVYVFNQAFSAPQIAYLYQHPYYAWEYPEIWEYYVAAVGANAPTGTIYGPLMGPMGGPV